MTGRKSQMVALPNSLHPRLPASHCDRAANVIALPFPTMLEHKRPTTSQTFSSLSQSCGEKPRAVCASKKALLPSPSTQTTGPSKTVNSLLDILISCYKGLEVELWMEFKITPGEIQTLWSMLERKRSLYDYVLGELP